MTYGGMGAAGLAAAWLNALWLLCVIGRTPTYGSPGTRCSVALPVAEGG